LTKCVSGVVKRGERVAPHLQQDHVEVLQDDRPDGRLVQPSGQRESKGNHWLLQEAPAAAGVDDGGHVAGGVTRLVNFLRLELVYLRLNIVKCKCVKICCK
jgi:hypothetical protein